MGSWYALLFLAGLSSPFGACWSEDQAQPKLEPPPLPETVAKEAKLKLEYEEKRFFESPVWDPKGEKLYFSSFGSKKSAYLMRLDETGKASIWSDKTDGAGGLKMASDGRLRVTQSEAHRVVSYEIGPDGMSIDALGNVYGSGLGGVWVISPEGKGLGLIPVPEFCSNVAFGGKAFKTLYLTCRQKVYSLEMAVEGGRAKKE